jgi:UDPglucose--hexose-1-phosphate uridylyltransferase
MGQRIPLEEERMPELRKDPVLGRWIIIATDRKLRPYDFKTCEAPVVEAKCPFCPGNEGMTPPEIYAMRDPSTSPNTPGWQVRVIPNKYPALRIEGDLDRRGKGIYDTMNGVGAHEVIIETPDHTRTLSQLGSQEVEAILRTYHQRIEDLKRDDRLRYILIFKNQGREAGASLAHAHSQLIATPVTPKTVKEELNGSHQYYELKERCIFCDMIRQEVEDGIRLVYQNDGFIAFCPYASRFPFETWILPKEHSADFGNLANSHVPLLADCLLTVLTKLRLVLNDPQYNYIIHTAPNRNARPGYWKTIDLDYHWHIEIMPRLTREAGFERATGFYINPTMPEDAAQAFREAEG